jgi:NADH dehydrogenase
MSNRLATVFGGSGFIGRHVVQRLAAQGWRVRVATRDPEGSGFLRPRGDVGQIVPVYADLSKDFSLKAAVSRADLVINLVGILFEKGKSTFESIHVRGAGQVAQAAAAAGVRAFVQVSALGADGQSPALYARSKAAGEAAVRSAFAAAVILRPSVVFGPEDQFFNRFAAMATLSPILPLIAGQTRLQPIYVGDLADAIVAAARPSEAGKTFELGGPRAYTMREIYTLTVAAAGLRRLILPVPTWLAQVQAALLQNLPTPPLTLDQMKLLAVDNVVSGALPGLDGLGITPQPVEAILPTYLLRSPSLAVQTLI